MTIKYHHTSILSKSLVFVALLASTSLLSLSACSNDKATAEVGTEVEKEVEKTEVAANVKADTDVTESKANFGTPENKPSIVVSDTLSFAEGSPEVTLAKALNTIYYANAADAAKFYQTDIKDFATQLQQTQVVFQKTVKQIKITDIAYNDDGSEATINGLIYLVGVEAPDSAEFYLQKIDGEWKVLG